MTETHAFKLSFGAEIERDGRVRFRFWAPAQKAPKLVLDDAAPLALESEGDGWFSLTTAAARAGSRYRYRLDDGLEVPDPASRAQADDAHGPSVVVDPRAMRWQTRGWTGRPWEETVLYELHAGTFSEDGSFDGVRRRLDHLAGLGVTAVELMPVADFPGRRNWGYDGVLMFAPDRAYGSPESLKTLVDEAHARGLMMFLDVVYNHFGPDGNYLHTYAPGFFTDRFDTPWGAAIDFSRRPVRDFYIENALYWLEEYRFDGLRFDAVHAIRDESARHILDELGETVRARLSPGRRAHLVLENDANEARFLDRLPAKAGRPAAPRAFTAQWNDDIHHVFHVLGTGEAGGYYADYQKDPASLLGRALTQGFVYQGDRSAFHDGARRGEPSAHLPPDGFVAFAQNHDQVGNRAWGDRLARLVPPETAQAVAAALLLSPAIPLLFMGEEWGATQPFLYFCDFHDALADAVRNGRRREFGRFPEFADPASRERIPDPNAETTFAASRLDWPTASMPGPQAWLDVYRRLLAVRRAEVVPLIPRIRPGTATATRWGVCGLTVTWPAGPDGPRLHLVTNLAATRSDGCRRPMGRPVYQSGSGLLGDCEAGYLPAWSVLALIEDQPAER